MPFFVVHKSQTRRSRATAEATRWPWAALAIVSIAQLMIVLDATIVNIALPSAQSDLDFALGSRQWVVSAYAVAFGSLLLLGGRLSDLFGRRLMMSVGLTGFAVASALGGAAPTLQLLIVSRVAQGVFAAVVAPAALATVAVTFTDPVQRRRAFGVFSAIAGIGAGVGLILGGVLTEFLSWRWCLYVNIAFAVVALAGLRIVPKDAPSGVVAWRSLDLPGAVTSTGGLSLVVLAVGRAQTVGWTTPSNLACLGAGLLLLAAFVRIESRSREALLSLRLMTNTVRGGANFSVAMLGVTIFGVFLFLTYFLQQRLGYSPLLSGLAFLPLTATILGVSAITTSLLLPRIPPGPLMASGLLLSAAAAVSLAQVDTSSGYLDGVLPGLVVAGIGAGILFPTTYAGGTSDVDYTDTGVASALVNTSQQVGGSIGIALLSTVYASAIDDAPSAAGPMARTVAAYSTTYWWAAGLSAAAAIITLIWFRSRPANQ